METQGDNYLDVNVAVSDDAIVVTLPGFSATYRKRDEPWLIASDIRDDPSSSIHTPNHKVHGTTSGEMLAQTRDFIENLFRQRRIGILKVGDKTATNIFDLLQT
jgi:hypothetical protein